MNPILYWNDVAMETHRRDFAFDLDAAGNEIGPEQGGPTRTSRAMAMVHLAMYDAAHGTPASPKNYLNKRSGQNLLPMAAVGASRDTAIACAAVTTLHALFSRQGNFLEERMHDFCSTQITGQTAQALSDGITFGRGVATALLQFRSNDRSNASDSHIGGDAPGNHRPDPYHPTQGYLGPQWGKVEPFLLKNFDPANLSTFLSDPPAFSDPLYREHFIEVREHGAKQRRSRSVAQEMRGVYWAYDGAKGLGTPPRLYNQVVRKILDARPEVSDVLKSARLLAMIHAGMADAGIVAWAAKYKYNLWRPVLGVREDDLGTGPTALGTPSSAKGDPAWEPYGAPHSNRARSKNFTPPFPAYPSGHATFGTTSLELARSLLSLPNNFSFKFVSDELNGRTVDVDGSVRTRLELEYTIDEAIRDNLLSRVWLGVHWKFDGDGGKQAGEKVAQLAVASQYLE